MPLHLWTYILSFASRDWFEAQKSEAELLAEVLPTVPRHGPRMYACMYASCVP
jgi:hypothetical protein